MNTFNQKKKTVLFIFIFSALLLSLSGISLNFTKGASITLQTAEVDNLDDGMIIQNYSSTEYGAYNQMNVGAPGSAGERQSYIKFSLASLPQGSTITSALLQLYYAYDGLETDDKLFVSTFYVLPSYLISGQQWTEGTGGSSGDPCANNELCWNTRPTGNQISDTPESSLLFDKSQGAFSGWYSWPVTQAAQQGVNSGNGSITIALRSSWVGGSLAISDFLGFRTKEHWYSSVRPRLIINYETGPVFDAAVTSLSVPASANQGTIVPASATVKNEGNQTISFSVQLNDLTDGALLGVREISDLAAGDSLNLFWDWDTSSSSLGIHSIEARASVVPGETDTTDNVKNGSTTITLPDTTAPVISNVQASSVTSNSATITWDTDEPSDSLVRFGVSLPPGNVVTTSTLLTSHSLVLTGLSATTTYYFEVQSSDASGNTIINNNGGFYYSFTTLPAPVVTVPGCENEPTRQLGNYYYSPIFNYEQPGWYSGRDLNHDNAAFATPFPICQRTRITGFGLDILASPNPGCRMEAAIYSDAVYSGNHFPNSRLWSAQGIQGDADGFIGVPMDMWLDPGVYHVVWASSASTGCSLPPGVHGTAYAPYIDSINASGQNEVFASYGGGGLPSQWPYRPWSTGAGAYYLKLLYAEY